MPTIKETMSRILRTRIALILPGTEKRFSSYRNRRLMASAYELLVGRLKVAHAPPKGSTVMKTAPWGLGLSGLQRREFVLVFLLFAPYYLLFQKASGQVSAADAECDRQTKHQGPEGNSESNEHGLFRQSQLLKHDRQYKNDDDAADGETQHLGRRHIRIYGGHQGGPGKK